MEPDRWQKIERLYHSALAEENDRRAAFLEQACAGDEPLRRQVELLLTQDERGDGFLEEPALKSGRQGPGGRSRLGRQVRPANPTSWLAERSRIT